jgi:hypothetical protein
VKAASTRTRTRREGGATTSPPPVPLAHPAFLAAAAVAIAAILVTVSFRIFDYDLWEHLVVGKYLWTAHRIPTTQLWTWPTYGQPAIIPSWGFRILLWPFWSLGGEPGLFVWRWIAALATFGILFLAARRMGAEPLSALVVMLLAALTYRGRTMVRPETLALVLFAAQIAILEARRLGGPKRDAWLVAIAWVWINVHLSFYAGFVLLGLHTLGAAHAAWRRGARGAAIFAGDRGAVSLLRVALLALAVSFLNPFGWRAVFQPLELLLVGRHEVIYSTVDELRSLDWRLNWRNGLPLLMAGWPLLLVWRARRRGLDAFELLACLAFSAQALASQRFKAAYAVVAAPYVARDLGEWLGAMRRSPLALPLATRSGVAIVAMVVLGLPEWSLPQFPLGLDIDRRYFPVAACDFIEKEGIRGRAFNHFWYGGYMEWRFWPERDRLPFMDGHLESGTERDRWLYAFAQEDRDAWSDLDDERKFDFVLLSLKTPAGAALRGFIEGDSTWATVFIDDAAVVYARREGAMRAVAERRGYARLRTAPEGLDSLLSRCAADSALRREVGRECDRQVRESPYHSVACGLLAELALMDGRRDEARRQLERALEADPGATAARARLREIEAEP